MLWFIIVGIFLLSGVISLILYSNRDFHNNAKPIKQWAFKNEDYLECYGWIMIVIFGVSFLCLLGSIAGIDSRFKSFENEYNATKELVESYHGNDYGNAPALTEKIIYINDEISKHKAKYDNPWFNVWNSEDIGNLEQLTFNTK